MRVKCVIIIGLILAFSGAEALDLKETITVNGNGDLYARTNIPYAKDLAQGFGTQTYSRAFGYESAISGSFDSKYTLKSARGNGSDPHSADAVDGNSKYDPNALPDARVNRYLIEMVDPSEMLRYVASIDGLCDIHSDNSVKFVPFEDGSYHVASKYDMSGEGMLKEKITDLRTDIHPVTLAEARANGRINLASESGDELKLPLTFGYYTTPEYLSSKVPLHDKPTWGDPEDQPYIGNDSFINVAGQRVTLGNCYLGALQSKIIAHNAFNRPVSCYLPSPT